MTASDYDVTIQSSFGEIVYKPGRHKLSNTTKISRINFNGQFVIVTLVSSNQEYSTYYESYSTKPTEYILIIIQISHVPVIFQNHRILPVLCYSHFGQVIKDVSDIFINVWQIEIEGKSVVVQYRDNVTNVEKELRFYSSVYYLPAYFGKHNNFSIKIKEVSNNDITIRDSLSYTNVFSAYHFMFDPSLYPVFIQNNEYIKDPYPYIFNLCQMYIDMKEIPQRRPDEINLLLDYVILYDSDGNKYYYEHKDNKSLNVNKSIRTIRVPKGLKVTINGGTNYYVADTTHNADIYIKTMVITDTRTEPSASSSIEYTEIMSDEKEQRKQFQKSNLQELQKILKKGIDVTQHDRDVMEKAMKTKPIYVQYSFGDFETDDDNIKSMLEKGYVVLFGGKTGDVPYFLNKMRLDELRAKENNNDINLFVTTIQIPKPLLFTITIFDTDENEINITHDVP